MFAGLARALLDSEAAQRHAARRERRRQDLARFADEAKRSDRTRANGLDPRLAAYQAALTALPGDLAVAAAKIEPEQRRLLVNLAGDDLAEAIIAYLGIDLDQRAEAVLAAEKAPLPFAYALDLHRRSLGVPSPEEDAALL